MTPTPNPFLQSALSYAARGWRVLPLVERNKIPLTPHAVKDATTDEHTIRFWWQRWPQANVGIACGADSGLIVVDLDNSETRNGVNAWKSLIDSYGDTLTVAAKTGSGGRHLYFKWKEGTPNLKDRIGPGVEVRGNGLYVAAPPSIHPSGTEYEWIIPPDAADLAELPDWVIPAGNLAGNVDRFAKPLATHGEAIEAAERAKRYLETIDDAVSGQGGHKQTLRAACECFRFGLTESQAWDLLNWFNVAKCNPAWNEKELRHKLREGKKLVEKDGKFGEKLQSEPDTVKFQPLNFTAVPTETAPPLSPRPIPTSAFPAELLSPPGIVGEILAYINATAYKPQPVLALANTLAFWGTVIGRKVRTPTDLRSNLYCLGVGESGCGKDHSRKCIKKICDATGLAKDLLGGEEVASDSAVMASVHNHPSILFQLDEIGHMISQNNSKYAASHQRNITPTFTKLFTSANTILIGKEYANGERKDVQNPNVCLYGTGNPGDLYNSLTIGDITNGFLGRVLVFKSDNPDPKEGPKPLLEVPAIILDAVKKWMFQRHAFSDDLPREHKGNLSGRVPITVPFNDEAEAEILRFQLFCAEMKCKCRDGTGIDALWARALEHARKVCLVIACGNDFDSPVVDWQTAAWSVKLINHLTTELIETVRDSVSSSDFGRDTQRVMTIIKREGSVTGKKLCRLTRGLHPSVRKYAIEELEKSEQIRVTRLNEGKPGAPAFQYSFLN